MAKEKRWESPERSTAVYSYNSWTGDSRGRSTSRYRRGPSSRRVWASRKHRSVNFSTFYTFFNSNIYLDKLVWCEVIKKWNIKWNNRERTHFVGVCKSAHVWECLGVLGKSSENRLRIHGSGRRQPKHESKSLGRGGESPSITESAWEWEERLLEWVESFKLGWESLNGTGIAWKWEKRVQMQQKYSGVEGENFSIGSAWTWKIMCECLGMYLKVEERGWSKYENLKTGEKWLNWKERRWIQMLAHIHVVAARIYIVTG